MRVFILSDEKSLVTSRMALQNAGLFPLIIHTFGVKGRLLNLWVQLRFGFFYFHFIYFFYSLFLLKNIEIKKFVRGNNIDNWSFMNKMFRILSCVSNVNVLWVDIMYRIEYVDEKRDYTLRVKTAQRYWRMKLQWVNDQSWLWLDLFYTDDAWQWYTTCKPQITVQSKKWGRRGEDTSRNG